MKTHERLDRLMLDSPQIEIDDNWKSFHTSDEHMASGKDNDDFKKNSFPYLNLLKKYYDLGFTHIRHGDYYELWEERNFLSILKKYVLIHREEDRYRQDGRLYTLLGNHDRDLLPNLIHESLVLVYKPTGQKILLAHGHQGDSLNDRYWKVGRFFTRYIWKPLQMIGLHDPTSYNLKKHETQEKELKSWCEDRNQIGIFGHTHNPFGVSINFYRKISEIPSKRGPYYWNCGSWVGKQCSCVEISSGRIFLRVNYVPT